MRHLGIPGLGLLLGLAGAPASQAAAGDYAAKREAMVGEIRAMSRESGTGALAAQVLEAMGRVARHEFVPPELVAFAYDNRPLPIGEGQTISQPYIVALMTDLAGIRKGDRVLEVGTGSGYQAAVLAELGVAVHSIEIVAAARASARERLGRLGYGNIEVVAGDGYNGIEARAPFDAILVTAGADHMPPALVRQLKPGGRMVIPVGEPMSIQQLTVIEKGADGKVKSRLVIPVRFVPLTR